MFTALISAILATVVAVTGIAVTADQNNKQREANKQQQEFAAGESEKAYQRSKPIQQIADKVQAGMSPQQARMSVAATGTPAAYTPATPVNQMQGIDQSAMMPYISQLMTGLSDPLIKSIDSPTGGFAGQLLTEDFQRIVLENIDKIPEHALVSSAAFRQYLAESRPDWAQTDEFQKAYKKTLQSVPGIAATNNFFTQLHGQVGGSKQINLQNLDIRKQTLSNQLAKIQIDDAAINFMRNDLKWRSGEQELIPLINTTSLQNYKNQLETAIREGELLSNPVYRANWLNTMLQDQANQLITAQVLHAILNGTSDYLNDPSAQSFLGILNAFKMVGFGGSLVSDVIVGLTASGVNVIPSLQDLGSSLNGLLDPITDAIQGLANDVIIPITEAGKQIVQEVGASLKDLVEGKDYMRLPRFLFNSTVGYLTNTDAETLESNADEAINKFADALKQAYKQEKSKIQKNGVKGYLQKKKFGVKDGQFIFVDEN